MKRKISDKVLLILLLIVNVFFIVLILLSCGYKTKPTKKEVYTEIVNNQIEFPEVVWKQAWLESKCGEYSNNLFGFRSSKDYYTYDHWSKSIEYYKDWQDRKLIKYKQDVDSVNIDYYDVIWWSEYKDGKKYSKEGKGYIDYLKKISFNLK